MSKEGMTFETLLAATIEKARKIRDEAGPGPEMRSMALVITNLETAALWFCEYRAQLHLGENALADWLLEIS